MNLSRMNNAIAPRATLRTVVCACAVLACLSATPTRAQTSAGGSIAGYVTDQQGGAIAHARVELVAAARPPRVTTTDSAGHYLLADLDPALYTLIATSPGFSARERPRIDLRAGAATRIDLVLPVGAITQQVAVVTETPLVDTRSVTQSVNLSGDLARGLPLSSARQWSDILSIAPGVTIRSIGPLAVVHAVRGSDVGSNVVQVDGANLASGALGTTATVNVIPGAIEDMQVKTAAMDASAPLGLGAVINVSTRSGTNQLRSTLAIDVQRPRWNDTNVEGGGSATVSAAVPELTVGGPIARNRLWFFGAVRHEHSEQGVSRTAQQLRTLEALAPGFAPVDRHVGGTNALVKVSGRAGRHDVEATYHYMPREIDTIAPTDAGAFSRTVLGGERSVGSRWTAAWPRVLTRVTGAFSDNAQQNLVGLERTARRIFTSTLATGGRLTGAGLVATLDNGGTGQSGEQQFWRATGSVDLASDRRFRGRHDLRAGLSFQRNHEESIARFANGGFAREENVLVTPANPAAGYRPFWREVWDRTSAQAGLGTSDDLAVYVQDLWEPATRLSVTLGLRADVIRRHDDLFDVLVQRGTAIGPRGGLTYSLTADGRHTARVSWSRVHDVLSGNRAVAGAASAGKTDSYDLDLNGTFETVLTTPPSEGASRNRIFDPDRGQPFVDEWTAGYRALLPLNVRLDVAWVRREYRNRTAAIEVNGIYDDGVFRGYRDVTQNEIYRVTANTWNWPVYQSLEVHASHRQGRTDTVVSYTRGWRHISGTWQPNDPASFLQPNAFANHRAIGGVRAPVPQDANSLSGTHMTADSAAWLDHAVSGAFLWQAPWRLHLATTLQVQSGPWSGPVVTRAAAPDPGVGPSTVRLSNGRMVSNPLATLVRFASPTRGDGQLQAPALRLWNLRAGWNAFEGARRLQLGVDIFNVPNLGAATSFAPNAHQTFGGEFGQMQNAQPPRSARFYAQLTF